MSLIFKVNFENEDDRIINFRLAIVDADGVLQHAKEDRRNFCNNYSIENRMTAGFDKFVQRDILFDPANRLLPGNKLTIYCEVSIHLHISEKNFCRATR